MSTPWTAPGSSAADDQAPTTGPDHGPFDPVPQGSAPGSAQRPPGPRRELTQAVPLFPLRPLGLGEVLGAAVRIYRLRARSVLGVAAAVYSVAFVLMTVATGAGMVPMLGEMQAVMADPEAPGSSEFTSAGDAVLWVLSSAASGIITMVAASLVTVALTQVAMGEAVGRHVSTAQMWAVMRRRGLPAIGIGLLVGAVSLALFLVLTGLGMLPIVLLQEATWPTAVPLVLGLLLGLLAALWIWARTVLAVPTLVIEEVGVLRAIRRSLVLTRGRRVWRVLGTTLLLYVLYTIAVQVVASVFGTLAFVAYLGILLATSFEGIVLAMIVLVILSMVGSFIATFLLAPFLSAGVVAIYADGRMRHEAWDVELQRRAREAWDASGPR